jgi:hypothetical protein
MDCIDKFKITNDNLLLLEYMIKVWKFATNITWINCPLIIRQNHWPVAKVWWSCCKQHFSKKKLCLNTLMARDKKHRI